MLYKPMLLKHKMMLISTYIFHHEGFNRFITLLRLAMLSKKEVHFILMPFHEFQRTLMLML
ncbi:hypothetical domain protein [Mycoplasmoides gallisepticum str. F]|nr:hypothetical domain protein [Mycoplasmoides gallisepticum str. F]